MWKILNYIMIRFNIIFIKYHAADQVDQLKQDILPFVSQWLETPQ